MTIRRSLRRSLITVLAAGYYVGVVQLTGLSVRPTSMSQFFGHAMIYVAAVWLVSSVLFLAERASSKRREEALSEAASTPGPRSQ